MDRFRANSSPELVPSTTPNEQYYDDSALEGVAANVKLLLKLIQDHKDACKKEKNDSRRMLRVATMMTILENIRTRIQTSQSFGNKKSEAELRRCNTDLKPPKDKKTVQHVADEKERLRKELNASLAARKSLQVMCSTLGKEKEIMAAELSRKAQELNGMEELVNDLRAQNETLLEKVHEKKLNIGGESQGNAALQERNKMLAEQLLRSLDGYKSMKRKLKEVQEENDVMRSTIDEMGAKVESSLDRVRNVKENVLSGLGGDRHDGVQESITELERTFEGFQMIITRQDVERRTR